MVNSGQGEVVLQASAIQIYEVDARSPFPVCLFDHDDVGQLLRVIDFPDEVSGEQLVHLVHNYLICCFGDEPVEGCHPSCKGLHFFDRLREDISRIAFTFFGFSSILLCDTMKPRNFPEETPKAHLARFSFILYYLSVSNIFLRSSK